MPRCRFEFKACHHDQRRVFQKTARNLTADEKFEGTVAIIERAWRLSHQLAVRDAQSSPAMRQVHRAEILPR